MIHKFQDKNMMDAERQKVFKEDKIKDLAYRLSISLISEFLKDNGMNYTLSVFLPETEFEKDVLSREELGELLSLRNPNISIKKNDKVYSILESIVNKVFSREIMCPKTFNMAS